MAKKLKIRIPREEYELEIGFPPVIPSKELEKSDTSVIRDDDDDNFSMNACLSSPQTIFSDTDALDAVSSETCLSIRDSEFKHSLFEELPAEMSAYMRSSSPIQMLDPLLSTGLASLSRGSSPLTSSSPPRSSPLLDSCLLTLPKDMIVDEEDDAEDNSSQHPSDCNWLSKGISSIDQLCLCSQLSRPYSLHTNTDMLVNIISAFHLFWSACKTRRIRIEVDV